MCFQGGVKETLNVPEDQPLTGYRWFGTTSDNQVMSATWSEQKWTAEPRTAECSFPGHPIVSRLFRSTVPSEDHSCGLHAFASTDTPGWASYDGPSMVAARVKLWGRTCRHVLDGETEGYRAQHMQIDAFVMPESFVRGTCTEDCAYCDENEGVVEHQRQNTQAVADRLGLPVVEFAEASNGAPAPSGA